MEPDFEELSISNEIIEKEADSNGCNVDLQQNCLSAKKYNVAYVRSKDTNRFRFDFAADTDGSRLCEIACTQVRGLKYVIFKFWRHQQFCRQYVLSLTLLKPPGPSVI